MADRDELERRVTTALEKRGELDSLEWGRLDLSTETYTALAQTALDALGLTEETVWTDDGDPEVQDRLPDLTYTSDGILIGRSSVPATDDELRAFGLIKKRRWNSEWEVVDD